MTTPVLPQPEPKGPTPGLPEFTPAMRGYDRGQVDDYVARLGDFVADAEQRAQRAEDNVAELIRRNERLTEELRQAIDRRRPGRSGAAYDGLGERVSEILRLATEEADAIRMQARTDSEAMVTEATKHRASERESRERELAEMTTRRDAVVAELRRVQEVLATLGLGQHVLPAEAIEAAATAATDLPTAVDPAPADDAETRVIRLPAAAATS